MQNQLQKVIELVKKTGDRVIVFDQSNPDNAYVLMGLEEYEKVSANRQSVRGLTEEELVDKINRDIAIWKNENNYEEYIEKIAEKEQFLEEQDINKSEEVTHEFKDDEYEKTQQEDLIADIYKQDFSSPGLRSIQEGIAKKKSVNNWNIPAERKEAAEENVDEEDNQYLEEIPF